MLDYDSKIEERTISPVFTQEKCQDWQAAEPGDILNKTGGRGSRKSCAVFQASMKIRGSRWHLRQKDGGCQRSRRIQPIHPRDCSQRMPPRSLGHSRLRKSLQKA